MGHQTFAEAALGLLGCQTDRLVIALIGGVELAEQALENTGWTIDWQLPDWAIPAGLLTYSGTPIERILQILKPLDGVLYTHPASHALRASLRYPTPSWDWPGAVADVSLPAAVIRDVSRSPDYKPPYNGVYISGTTSGVLAQAKITGTAGDLQAPMVSDILLADSEGIAARARAIAVLSASGAGVKINVTTQLTPIGDSSG
ncbi:MAG: hypothetical protein WCG26_09580, partial [Chloroflexales bacterium]